MNSAHATPPVPTTLSDLLLMAVDDAEHIGRQRGYTLNMDLWHDPCVRDDTCHVCMAGAVMARRLGANPAKMYEPSLCPPPWQRALYAVNSVRNGRLDVAYLHLFGHYASYGTTTFETLTALGTKIQDVYDDDMGRAPWSMYREVAASLQEAGL